MNALPGAPFRLGPALGPKLGSSDINAQKIKTKLASKESEDWGYRLFLVRFVLIFEIVH